MEYTIRQGRFEGPYSKLLSLIEERKLSITEVSLASVAEDYTKFAQSLPKKDYNDVSQFIVVASTLMLIKVRSLLPGIVFTEEEERQVKGLEKKLELFAVLCSAVKIIEKRWGKSILYLKKESLSDSPMFVPSDGIKQEALATCAMLMISFTNKKELLKKISVKQLVRMEEIVERMIARVQNKISFYTLSHSLGIEETGKVLLLSFLALLELIRLGKLDADQSETGGEITIMPRARNEKAKDFHMLE